MTARRRLVLEKPPMVIRGVGIALLAADVWLYIREHLAGHQETMWSIVGHALWALVAMTMAYPEGGRQLMNFARRTVPMLDRRGKGE